LFAACRLEFSLSTAFSICCQLRSTNFHPWRFLPGIIASSPPGAPLANGLDGVIIYILWSFVLSASATFPRSFDFWLANGSVQLRCFIFLSARFCNPLLQPAFEDFLCGTAFEDSPFEKLAVQNAFEDSHDRVSVFSVLAVCCCVVLVRPSQDQHLFLAIRRLHIETLTRRRHLIDP